MEVKQRARDDRGSTKSLRKKLDGEQRPATSTNGVTFRRAKGRLEMKKEGETGGGRSCQNMKNS